LRAGQPTATGRPQAVVVPSNVAPTSNPVPTYPPAPTSTPMATFAAAAQGPTAVAGQWLYPDSTGPVLGLSGPLLRFRIAVEQGLSVPVPEFTAVVDSTLGDGRSWIAGGDVRLQRVSALTMYDFSIFLATPDTAYRMCLAGGSDIRVGGVPYTSCRAGDNVIINAARYQGGVPDYGAPLEDYQRYVVNHEVGHRLGHGHVLCTGPGQPAPVMQQQTMGLQGCVANSWPYINGKLHTGPAVA
jgi:hypothetical protein